MLKELLLWVNQAKSHEIDEIYKLCQNIFF